MRIAYGFISFSAYVVPVDFHHLSYYVCVRTCNVVRHTAFDIPGLDVTCFCIFCGNIPCARNYLAKAAGSLKFSA
eukprot:5188504-Heterocapsa_arctica.AAC.1